PFYLSRHPAAGCLLSSYLVSILSGQSLLRHTQVKIRRHLDGRFMGHPEKATLVIAMFSTILAAARGRWSQIACFLSH
ncbi:MAG: hypothetical protein QME60_03290, partial [Verrucomicrobiota bacterium]|nr:hypothetical protein [Verrucomicrobiota bacterium]